MAKKGHKDWTIGILIGVIIALAILSVFFLLMNKNVEEEVRYYCNIDLSRVSCVSNFDCNSVNGICDLNELKCVPANINFDLYFSGDKEDCENVGGLWEKGEEN